MKKKVLKIFIIILLLVLLLFIVNLVRNYIILNNLKEKITKLKGLEKYSEIIKSENDETKITKYKNISKVEFLNKDIIMYFNSDTNELIEENIRTGERKYYTDRLSSINLLLLDLDGDFWEILLKNIITTKNINEEKCYKIKVYSLNQTYYVSSENGLTLRIDNHDSEVAEYNNVSYLYQLDNIEQIDFEELKKTVIMENESQEHNTYLEYNLIKSDEKDLVDLNMLYTFDENDICTDCRIQWTFANEEIAKTQYENWVKAGEANLKIDGNMVSFNANNEVGKTKTEITSSQKGNFEIKEY